MTTRQAPRRRAAPSLSSAIALLALGIWMSPAFSATGTNARCDETTDYRPMSIADDRELPIQVIGHGTDNAAAADDTSPDDAVADATTRTVTRPTGPRVDIMLRRIFDEARARQPSLSEPEETSDLSAPLAGDKPENVEEPAAVLEADPVDSSAELPGFSADEVHRYRQQMYRTDI